MFVTSANATPANTLYYGGDIITLEGDKPEYVEAVVEREGKIVFLGTKQMPSKVKAKQKQRRKK